MLAALWLLQGWAFVERLSVSCAEAVGVEPSGRITFAIGFGFVHSLVFAQRVGV